MALCGGKGRGSLPPAPLSIVLHYSLELACYIHTYMHYSPWISMKLGMNIQCNILQIILPEF